MKTLIIVVILILTGCASNPNRAQYVDTNLKPIGVVQKSEIGLNSKDEIVIQEITQLDSELSYIKTKNFDLQDDVNEQVIWIERCREELADPRLGGIGDLEPFPKQQDKAINIAQETIGQTDTGDIRLVKKEYYIQRLKIEREKNESLSNRKAQLSDIRTKCERKLKVARIKANLPGERIKSEGYVTADGKWVETKKGEKNLDDAFTLSRQPASK